MKNIENIQREATLKDSPEKDSQELFRIGLDEIVISRFEYEKFRHALGFCNFICALDKPIGAKARQTITLQKLIEKAKAIIDLYDEEV